MRRAVPLLAAAAMVGCAGTSGGSPGASPTAPTSPVATVAPSPIVPVTESPTPSARPTAVPTPAPIVVEIPAAGDTVTVPFTVSGTADVFEAQFVLDLLDASGTVVVHQQVTASSGSGTRGTYSTTVTTAYRGPATLDVYDISGKGEKIDDVRIPVVIGG
jgi:hypothetical protein